MTILREDNQLSISDLLQYPVWEFAYDEMRKMGMSGKMRMKPSEIHPPYDPHQTRILVRATFRLRDGTLFKGYIKPIDLLKTNFKPIVPIDLLPVIITNQGYVDFWYGIYKPDEAKIAKNYSFLGKTSSEVFPIVVTSDVEIVNGISEGVLEGFLYCIEDEVKSLFRIKETDIKYIR